jgi:hypothetical protein
MPQGISLKRAGASARWRGCSGQPTRSPRGPSGVYPNVRVDAVFLAVRLVLEYDGRDHHKIDTDRDHDSRRELRLKADGIDVIRTTWWMVRHSPGDTWRRILAIYRQRVALGLPPVVPIRFEQCS